MWSMGKVFSTPEVKRVYISSFSQAAFREGTNTTLFERERDDLLKELRDLPRNAAVRKVAICSRVFVFICYLQSCVYICMRVFVRACACICVHVCEISHVDL